MSKQLRSDVDTLSVEYKKLGFSGTIDRLVSEGWMVSFYKDQATGEHIVRVCQANSVALTPGGYGMEEPQMPSEMFADVAMPQQIALERCAAIFVGNMNQQGITPATVPPA